jgi:hypothetical protein
MTAAQSLKIYEVLGRHFNNAEDARVVVAEIEQIIEMKITEKKRYTGYQRRLAETTHVIRLNKVLEILNYLMTLN